MYNRIVIMGRLCANPELKQTQSGVAVCKIRVAVNRPKNKDGEQQTDFFNVSCWKGTAELVSRYFTKGKMILVEGQMHNNDYTDQNGVKHYAMEILANSVAFCGYSAQNGNQNGGQAAQPSGYPAQQNNYAVPAQGYAQPQMPPQNPAQAMFGNPASPYGAAAPMAQPQRPAQAAMPQARNSQQNLSIGNLSEFEDILSDGELPF